MRNRIRRWVTPHAARVTARTAPRGGHVAERARPGARGLGAGALARSSSTPARSRSARPSSTRCSTSSPARARSRSAGRRFELDRGRRGARPRGRGGELRGASSRSCARPSARAPTATRRSAPARPSFASTDAGSRERDRRAVVPGALRPAQRLDARDALRRLPPAGPRAVALPPVRRDRLDPGGPGRGSIARGLGGAARGRLGVPAPPARRCTSSRTRARTGRWPSSASSRPPAARPRRTSPASASALLYDAGCRLCRFAARVVQQIDRDGELAILPLEHPDAAPLLEQLPEDERLSSWRVARPDGTLAGYGAGVVQLLASMRATRPLARVGSHVPAGLLDAAYAVVARNRGRLGRLVPDVGAASSRSQIAATSRASDSTESGEPDACSTSRSQRTDSPGRVEPLARAARRPRAGRRCPPRLVRERVPELRRDDRPVEIRVVVDRRDRDVDLRRPVRRRASVGRRDELVAARRAPTRRASRSASGIAVEHALEAGHHEHPAREDEELGRARGAQPRRRALAPRRRRARARARATRARPRARRTGARRPRS